MADRNHKRTCSPPGSDERSAKKNKSGDLIARNFSLPEKPKTSWPEDEPPIEYYHYHQHQPQIPQRHLSDTFQPRDHRPQDPIVHNRQPRSSQRHATVNMEYRPNAPLEYQISKHESLLNELNKRVYDCKELIMLHLSRPMEGPPSSQTFVPRRDAIRSQDMTVLGRQTTELQVRTHDVEKEIAGMKENAAAIEQLKQGLKELNQETKVVQEEARGIKQYTIELEQKIEAQQQKIEEQQKEIAALNDLQSGLENVAPPVHHAKTTDKLVQAVDKEGNEQIFFDSFIDWLETLDFRPPNGMVKWMGPKINVDAYSLFALDNTTHILQRTGKQVHRPTVSTRHGRKHQDNDSSMKFLTDPKLWWFREQVIEIEYQKPNWYNLVSRKAPRYVLDLGEVYTQNTGTERVPSSLQSTNYHLFMDVASPAKSLWMIYCYEYESGGAVNTWELDQDEAFCPGTDIFDMARIADGLEDFKMGERPGDLPVLDEAKVKKMVDISACVAEPVFTEPNLDALLKAIRDGWASMS